MYVAAAIAVRSIPSWSVRTGAFPDSTAPRSNVHSSVGTAVSNTVSELNSSGLSLKAAVRLASSAAPGGSNVLSAGETSNRVSVTSTVTVSSGVVVSCLNTTSDSASTNRRLSASTPGCETRISFASVPSTVVVPTSSTVAAE